MSYVARATLTDCQPISHSARSRSVGIGERLSNLVGTWRRRVRERDAFAALDYRDLRDMGLSRWEVEGELRKPFWRG